jgi:hypothetical protein
MWMVAQKAILTKDNMIARDWQGGPGCYFCGKLETVDHLLFSCPIAKVVWDLIALSFHQRTRGGDKFYMLGLAAVCWAIWLARNKLCFEKKNIKNPAELVFSAGMLMRYWSGLYPGDAQEVIETGVPAMISAVVQILEKKQKGCVTRMKIMSKDAPRDGDDVGQDQACAMVPRK